MIGSVAADRARRREVIVIFYADGRQVRKGDRVELCGGVPCVVDAIIDSEADRQVWGLDERGIMVVSEIYGLMFEPIEMTSWTAVVLRGRADGG